MNGVTNISKTNNGLIHVLQKKNCQQKYVDQCVATNVLAATKVPMSCAKIYIIYIHIIMCIYIINYVYIYHYASIQPPRKPILALGLSIRPWQPTKAQFTRPAWKWVQKPS